MAETHVSPERTEASVVWFAMLAKARQSGDAVGLEEAKTKLAELGIQVHCNAEEETTNGMPK